MGTDKAALIHPDGRSLARRGYDLLGKAGCDRVFLSLRIDQELPPGFDECDTYSIIRDAVEACGGPLSGMIAAMKPHPHVDWLVIACDLPRLDAVTLQHLVFSRTQSDPFLAYRSEFDGLPEPLCAFYAGGAAAVLEQSVAEGGLCPRKLLVRKECRLLDPVMPHALDNANTPEDWLNSIAS
jgi:molybdopterin-guanine dinucleotide biosynthesis protein A